jgi:hypothetical protein
MNNNIHSCDNCKNSNLNAEDLALKQTYQQKKIKTLFLCKECLDHYDKNNEIIKM